jgi:beta-glucosidase
MVSPHAKPETKIASTRRSNATQDSTEGSTSDSPWEQPQEMDTPSSGDESVETESNLRLLPLKQGKAAQDPQSSSSKSTDPNPTIDVPEGERDFSKRIEQFLGADRTPLANTFDTDVEDDSARTSLALSDDWGHPSDKGFLLKNDGEEEPKGFNWRSLFRLHSWWSVAGFLIIAIVLVWLSIRGLPWSSTGAAISETVSLVTLPFFVRASCLTIMCTAIGPLVPNPPRRNNHRMEGKLCQGAGNGQTDVAS